MRATCLGWSDVTKTRPERRTRSPKEGDPFGVDQRADRKELKVLRPIGPRADSSYLRSPDRMIRKVRCFQQTASWDWPPDSDQRENSSWPQCAKPRQGER